MKFVLKMFDKTLLHAMFASFFLVLASCGGGESASNNTDTGEPVEDGGEEKADKAKEDKDSGVDSDEKSAAESFLEEMKSIVGVCYQKEAVKSLSVYHSLFNPKNFENDAAQHLLFSQIIPIKTP